MKLGLSSLANLKLAHQFALLIGTVIFGFLLYGAVSLSSTRELQVNGPVYADIVQGKDLLADVLPPPEYIIEPYLVAMQMERAHGRGELDGLVERFNELERAYDTRHTFWTQARLDPDLSEVFLETSHRHAGEFFRTVRGDLIPALQAADRAGATAAFERTTKAYEEHRSAIDRTVELATAQNAASEAHAASQIASDYAWLAAAFLLAVGLATFIGLRIAALLRRQLGGEPAYAAEIATRMAAGELTEVRLKAGDTQSLLAAMHSMVETFKGFAAAQEENAKQHAAGMIDHQIPADRFPGVYGRMAASINTLVRSHIDVKMRVVEVVTRYADGDLSVDMDRLPGQKAKITAAIDGVKQSLQAVSGQIQHLVRAAVGGDFKARGDAQRFRYEFQEMVNGLNQLMTISDEGLGEVSRVLEALARGDLTQRIDGDYQGTFRKLQDDSNSTVSRLREVVGQIKDATDEIDRAAREIATGNQDLSGRTEEQASSLEETASAMEQQSTAVKENAENARMASELAQGSSESVNRGGEAVKRVVATMGDIQASSKKIADIITVIDGIAFQTNILALNAAVEAARAGEQGRGFAVVASEVRSLAQRSATAAKEIKDLIADSVGKVDGGVRLADEASAAMEQVVQTSERVTGLITEISQASREQSSGIEQVAQAIGQMDDITQQNAALVEEAAAAAESLGQQTQELVRSVSMFQLGSEQSDSRPSAARATVRPRLPKPTTSPGKKLAARASQAMAAQAEDEWSEL